MEEATLFVLLVNIGSLVNTADHLLLLEQGASRAQSMHRLSIVFHLILGAV